MHFISWIVLPALFSFNIQRQYRFAVASYVFIITYSILIGLQFDVGGDYFSYKSMLDFYLYEKFYFREEYLSYLIFKLADYLDSINVYYFVNGLFFSTSLIIISAKLNGKNYQNLFILICSWSLLFSLYNTTRQSLAAIIILTAFFIFRSYIKNRPSIFIYLFTLLSLIGFTFLAMKIHLSSIMAMIIIIISYFLNKFRFTYIIFLLFSVAIIEILIFNGLNYFPIFRIYTELEKDVSFLTIVGKFYPTLVFVFFILLKSVKFNLLYKNEFFTLYVTSLFFVIIAFTLQEQIVLRFYEYFSIFSILPYFLLAPKLFNEKKLLFWILLILFPGFKITIFATNEYIYNSILL